MQLKTVVLFVLFSIFSGLSFAQKSFVFEYKDPSAPAPLKLEAFLYEPPLPNGKVIVFSHGSTGGKKESIAESIKFMRIGKLAAERGYHLVSFMRKGRGKSEGAFVEETNRCDRDSLTWEVNDAYPQLMQVVEWSRKTYNTDKVILMGHSRGGFLSSYFAARNPDKVLAAVNLAGVWSAFCEARNGGFSHDALKDAATHFKNLYWAYFENDSYFASDRFGDPSYQWFTDTANAAGIRFKTYPQLDLKDGHLTPTWRPEVWANDVFAWLETVK